MKKAKQILHSNKPVPVPQQISFDVKHAHLVKGKTLHSLTVEQLGTRLLQERKFKSVKEIQELLISFASFLFGPNTFVIPLQKQVVGLFGKENDPSFFLLDLNGDVARPRFYIVTISLAKPEGIGSVLYSLGKYLFGLRTEGTVQQLIELVQTNKAVRKQLLSKMKAGDIPSYLKVALTHSNVLLIVNEESKELPEVVGTLSGTSWQSTKTAVLKKYATNGDTIISMDPSFNELHLIGKQRRQNASTSEEDHLEGVDPIVKEIYTKIKSELLKINNQLQFNSQKYYISLKKSKNVAFFHFSKKRINLVVMYPEKETRKLTKYHDIKTLTEKVQKFWNGPSCTIVIDDVPYLNEVINLLKQLVKE